MRSRSTGSRWSGCPAAARTPWRSPGTCPTGWWSRRCSEAWVRCVGLTPCCPTPRLLRFAAPPLEVLRTPVGNAVGSLVRLATPVADPVFNLYARVLGFADRPVLGHPQFKAMFLHDLITADDLRATAHDLALFARHWGFQLDEVTVPVVVWHGLADVIVPPSHGHHQAARLPRGELRVRPGEGHFAGFAEVADVLDRVREIWGDQTAEPVTVTTRRRRPRKSDS